MSDIQTPPAPATAAPDSRLRRLRAVLHGFVEVILIVVILGVAVLVAMYMMSNRPQADRVQMPERSLPVTVHLAETTDTVVTLNAVGYVVAASTLDLMPQVSGRVSEIAPALQPGSVVQQGDTVIQLERTDLQLTVNQLTAQIEQLQATLLQRRSEAAQRRSDVTQASLTVAQKRLERIQREQDLASAEEALRLEMAQQELAAAEVAAYGDVISDADRSIVLREPQRRQAEQAVKSAQAAVDVSAASVDAALAAVESARAAVASADAAVTGGEANLKATQAQLDQANLDLARTAVTAPFDGLVASRGVALGMQVSSGSTVATLVDVSEYWVRVRIPRTDMKWLQYRDGTQPGSTVRIRDAEAWGADSWRDGEVIQLLGSVEENGQMAQVLIAVPDPLARTSAHTGQPRLLLGAYVDVEINGQALTDVVALPRAVLRDGGAIWIASDTDALEIRTVSPIWTTGERIYLRTGLSPGERVITSDIASPVTGTKLLVPADSPAPPDANAEERSEVNHE